MVQVPGPPLGRSLEHIAQHIGDKVGGAVIERARYQLRDELRDINEYALNLQKAYGGIKDQELQLKVAAPRFRLRNAMEHHPMPIDAKREALENRRRRPKKDDMER